MEKRITIDLSLKTVLVALFTLAAAWFAYLIRDILVLFFVAFVFSTALEPLVDYLDKKKIPRILAVSTVYAVIALFLVVLVKLIIPPIAEQLSHLAENKAAIESVVDKNFDRLPEGTRDALINFWHTVPAKIQEYGTSGALVSRTLGVFSSLFTVITILVFSFYLLLEKDTIENFVTTFWPKKTREKALNIYKKIVNKVSLWARGQLILSGSIGVLTYIGLSLLGVDYALTLALIAAVTELLPILGPIIGAIPAIIIAFTVSPLTALWVLLLYVGTQQFESHVLVPQVMKRAVGLSPIAIIISVLVGGKLLGILGVIMAVPVASAVTVLLQSIGETGE